MKEEEDRESVRPEQTVSEMVEEVLRHQAKALLEQSGQSFKATMEAIQLCDTCSPTVT
jgi:hypothetical protein